ncbi:MAG: YczE/YyaS/YitT family protein [Microthrixaceae bacterium]
MTISSNPERVTGRLLTLAAGLLGVGTGVALMIRGEIGVAPYDVLTTGIASISGISVGLAAMLLAVAFVAAGTALGQRPGVGTFLALLLVGPILAVVLQALPHTEALTLRVALFAGGFFLVAAGITAVVVAELGPGPAEIVMLGLHGRGHPLAPARFGVELFCVAIGWVIGGQIGVGTVVVAVLIGPILRWMLVAAGFDATRSRAVTDTASPGA